MHYRTATLTDVPAIVALYKAVAKQKGKIARQEHEVTDEYVTSFIQKSIDGGLIIVGHTDENPDVLVAEIHAYRNGLQVFHHVLGDMTFVVHPDHQGKGIGRTILTIFLEEVATNWPDIGKVELFTSESNRVALGLYQSMGFLIEGRMEMRFRNAEGNYEADIPMGWINPGFEFDGTIPRLSN